ncbi:MAG: MerR family transcriptional regulator [Solirubrobacteraceae bacterium]
MEDSQSGIYSIGAVSRMLGVERATIRNWEERFGLVLPMRSAGGQRLFSRGNLERLRFVSGLVADGLSPAAAHQRLEEYLSQGRSLVENVLDQRASQPLVLLAERDRLAAELTEYFLDTEGYEVVSAFDADESLSCYEQLRPKLAIVDLLISGGGGLSLCRSLKQQGLPALLAISTLATQQQALEAGADAFLLKPVDPLRLVSTAKHLLGTNATAGARRGPKAGGS